MANLVRRWYPHDSGARLKTKTFDGWGRFGAFICFLGTAVALATVRKLLCVPKARLTSVLCLKDF